jgi:hypothetical protein
MFILVLILWAFLIRNASLQFYGDYAQPALMDCCTADRTYEQGAKPV